MKRFLLLARQGLAVAASALLLLPAAAKADALQDISRLLRQGQHAQALEQADKYLAGKPKDAQARFLKGIALTELNRPADAIAVFQKLTEDYPELPEPYNNLAVIYAQQKQYEKAKGALEMAIRTHPSYATAHENLGDIYARLASQAYDKALQLDSSNSSAQNKLSMIRDLMSGSGRPVARQPAKSEPDVKVADARPVETRPAETKPAAPPAAPAAAPAAPAKAEVAKAEPPKPEPKPAAAAPAKAGGGDQDDVARAVNQWAAAWAKKDVRGYLAAYAKDFKTPNGMARSKWESERRSRIDKPGTITVRLDAMKVSVSGDKATVRFRQHYEAGSLKATTGKTLEMVERDGKWLIVQERVGG